MRGQMKEPYVRALTHTHTHNCQAHSLTLKGATWIRMHRSLNGSLCGRERELCQFQPGFPLLGNVQWLNWWHGVFTHPCQNQWVTGQKRRANIHPHPPQPLHGGTSHPGVLSNTSTNTQGPFGNATREYIQLKSGRIKGELQDFTT